MDISIIIPVFNEKHIKQTIQMIKNQNTSYNYEIIVVDGNNSSTINLINDSSVIKINSKKGRAVQMNEGAKYATSPILFFLHADNKIKYNTLDLICNEKAKVGAFKLYIDSDKFYFRIIEKVVNLRSKITKIPYGDQGIFINKEIFNSIGRFSDLDIMEDVDLMDKVKKTGLHVKILNQSIITSPRRWQQEGVIYTTLRNWTIYTLYRLGVDSKKLVKFYKTTSLML